jgi:hypothetical protein
VGRPAGGAAPRRGDRPRRGERRRGGGAANLLPRRSSDRVPTKASKRRIVLERIAIEFDPGVRYDELEVNAIVGAFFNDHAALRRYLVDEGFLDRDTGVYWRAGGRVDA